MSSGLQNAIETLYGLERRRSDFRVEDTARLLAALGDPHQRFRSVHVAGTNGKGSVCTLVERVLRAAGLRTGLTTSPHLVDYRERIRISGQWPESTELEQRLAEIQNLEAARGRTFFEITTALAFDAFARHGVEWAVVEVGLGGRLDSTNVLTPEVCAITSIGLDHTEMLGPTIADVAREKAGILKPRVPVVVGALPDAAMETVIARGLVLNPTLQGEDSGQRKPLWFDALQCVSIANVRLDTDGARFDATCAPWGKLELSIALRGAHQVENARVALAILSVLAARGLALPANAVRDGLAAARWPGRLEPCPREPRLWWDGAHNLDGLERLITAWPDDLRLPAPEAIVFAASRDKPVADMLARLHAFAPGAKLFVARTRNERAVSPQQLAEDASAAGWLPQQRDDVGEAVADALAQTQGRVLLVGSLFAVGEAMQRFGGAPGACS